MKKKTPNKNKQKKKQPKIPTLFCGCLPSFNLSLTPITMGPVRGQRSHLLTAVDAARLARKCILLEKQLHIMFIDQLLSVFIDQLLAVLIDQLISQPVWLLRFA